MVQTAQKDVKRSEIAPVHGNTKEIGITEIEAEPFLFWESLAILLVSRAAVAQMDRVLGYEPRGRGFESCQPHHFFKAFSCFVSSKRFLHQLFVLPCFMRGCSSDG
jgi:hypothetical protein